MTPQILISSQPLARAALEETLMTFADHLRYCYLESERQVDLTRFSVESAAAFSVGRAFGPDHEVRWSAVSPQLWTVEVLSEQDTMLPGFEPSGLDLTVSEEYTVHLWGALAATLPPDHRLSGLSENIWIETRIPRAFAYPVASPARWVGARARDYLANQVVVATRWLELAEWEGN